MFELSVWSQPIAALTFQKLSECQPNECVSPANSMYNQPGSTNAHGLCYGLMSRAPQPTFLSLFRSVLFEPVKHGGNAILKTHWWRLYTNVESTRWGGIHKSSPNVRLALQTWQCKLHLMMQKEIPDDLSTPWEVQSRKAPLWTVDPTELLISLAGK